jgi:polyhydroxyalkanoate synthase
VIVERRVAMQVVDRDERCAFQKEVIVTDTGVPLSLVRKRIVTRLDTTRAPILLVHGFGQNSHAWHLPSRSLANFLAREGYDVFNVDLRGHGRSRELSKHQAHSLTDYIREDLPNAISEVRIHSGGRPVFVVGHSLGGLVTYGAAPDLRDALAGIVTIGSPYEFGSGSLALSAIATLFRAMSKAKVPVPRAGLPVSHFGGIMKKVRLIADGPLHPLPLRGWQAGAMEPFVLEQHLSLAFDRAGLGEMVELFEWSTKRPFGKRHGGPFEQVDKPLLVVGGTLDDLAPVASVRPAHERSASRDKTFRTFPLGHIDLLMGRDAPKTTWQLLASWLDARAPHA